MFSIFNPSIVRATLAAGMLSALVTLLHAQERVPFFDEKTKAPKTTRSPDGNFVVNGTDVYTRGIYSEFAVGVREDFQTLMNFRSNLKFPVVMNLSQAPGNRIAGFPVKREAVIIPPDFSYSPNVNITLCESLRMASVRENLVWCFLIDFAVRGEIEPGKVIEKRGNRIIPTWLWEGVSEAIGFKEAGEPSELFSAVFESGKLMSVDEILRSDPSKMSSLSRAVYRASAGGLVLSLLQQNDGSTSMRRFIDALAAAPLDQEALLRKFFPGVSDSNNSLEKWWALQVAQLAKPTSLDIFSIKETEDRLERALVVAVMENQRFDSPAAEPRRKLPWIFKKRDRGKKNGTLGAGEPAPVQQQLVNYDLSEYSNFMKREDLESILHQNELRLVQLSYRSFPLYRPLIKEYLDLITTIESGKAKGIDERFQRLAKTRAGLLRSGQMAEDLMNLHDATAADQSSGEFDEYFKLFDRLRKAKPVRADPISDYLDRIQSEVE